ncbi:MAG: CTP synthase [Candidatus Diapherotrites archaeon]|uniref:CTP synthase (glutamine hydrolyzing) n=1 Tax=Candidatus Iainarchaeum sp. TaxID=3101447 RepID=A0A8T3YK02_9ARCH|nr:CTP synthase [Candidatus Diapherotrites archaeon]
MNEKFLAEISDKSSGERFSAFPEGYVKGRTKYVIITGSVMSGIGKGIFSSALGKTLKDRGMNVAPIKVEAYLNIDSGTLSPYRHGEVFVLDDGTETDMDLGSYERFLDTGLSKDNFTTHGQIYKRIIEKERAGFYQGRDVQYIPHVTGETKLVLRNLAMKSKADIVLIEIGGTVGDYENLFAMESVRELIYEEGRENACLVNLTYILEPHHLGEFKSKAAQLGLRHLMSLGLQPDVVVCRSERPITGNVKEKISMNANVPIEMVFNTYDVGNIYELPLFYREQGLDSAILGTINLDRKFPVNGSKSLKDWTARNIVEPEKEITIGVAGKYTGTSDTYISIVKALEHCSAALKVKVGIKWIETTDLEKDLGKAEHEMSGIDGIIIPGGFGTRGVEGKIACAGHARKSGIPFLGICYGFQMAVIEFARNVCGIKGANTEEVKKDAENNVICILPEQEEVEGLGGTLRLGGFDIKVKKGTLAHELYGKKEKVRERFRHRFNVNTKFIDILEKSGMVFSGMAPSKRIMQILELPGHPFFIGTQYHAEFTSRPLKPNPVYLGLVKAALKRKYGK